MNGSRVPTMIPLSRALCLLRRIEGSIPFNKWITNETQITLNIMQKKKGGW